MKLPLDTNFDKIAGYLTILLLFFSCPVFVLVRNSSEFQHLSIPFTLAALTVCTALAALLLLICSRFANPLSFSYVRGTLRLFFFFVLSTVMLFPLATKAGQIEIHQIPLDVTNLFIAAMVAISLWLVSYSRLGTSVLVGAIVFIAVNTAHDLNLISRLFTPADTDAYFTASSKRNVFVLSLDGLPRAISIDVIQGDPELAKALKDFTVFRHVVGSSPATMASIATEISGIADLKTRYSTSQRVVDDLAYKPRMIPNRLASRGYSVSTYGMYALGIADKRRRIAIGTLSIHYTLQQRVDHVAALYRYAVARALSSYAVLIGDYLPSLTARIGFSDFLEDSDRQDTRDHAQLQSRLRKHAGAQWDISDTMTVLDFQVYLRRLSAGTEQPVAHFSHYLFSHFPVDFDENCNYRSDDADWFNSHQNSGGLRRQTHCALREFKRFVEKLKVLGIYDQSLIVLKSDHGEPPSYYEADSYESFRIRGSEHWGFGRYAPFLAFKNFDSQASQITFDERPVALVDLARSICATATKDRDCSTYEGYNIFDPANPIPTNATYSLQVVRNPSSKFYLDDHDALQLPRQTEFFHALNDHLTSELMTGRAQCDGIVNTGDGKPYNNGHTDGRSWVSWHDFNRTFLKIRNPKCRLTAIELSLQRPQTRQETAPEIQAVSVNGTDVQPNDVILNEAGSELTVKVRVSESALAGDFIMASVRLKSSSDRLVVTGFRFLRDAASATSTQEEEAKR